MTLLLLVLVCFDRLTNDVISYYGGIAHACADNTLLLCKQEQDSFDLATVQGKGVSTLKPLAL
jgi:hypothetical protein